MEVFLSYLKEVLESVVTKRAIKKAKVKFTDVLPLEEKTRRLIEKNQ